MKKILLLFVIWILSSVLGGADEKRVFVRVSKENPKYFELSDGSPYIPIGVNLCILRERNETGVLEQFKKDTERGLRKMEFYFKKLAENGGNYTRIWLSSDFYEIEHDKIGVYDPAVLTRIAETLALAKKYGIRIKFCMEHFRSISAKPSVPFFNRDVYVSDSKHSVNEYVNTDWGRDLYLNRCRAIISRFKDHPNVFAWELWNERNCMPHCIEWTKKMLPEIHKMSPDQMVMQSLGSFDSSNALKYYPQVVNMKENDAAQVHRYLDPGAPLEICRGPMDRLGADMVTVIREMVKDKPILATEMGAVEWRHAGPSKLYDLDHEGILFHDILFVPFFAGAAGSGHCWHWYQYLEKNDLWYHIGRFSKTAAGLDPVKERFEPFQKDQDFVRIYGLHGKTQTVIWLRDQESNWKTELIEKKPAPVRKNFTLDLTKLGISNASSVVLYDPWLDREISGSIENGKLTLPDFRRSFVVKIRY